MSDKLRDLLREARDWIQQETKWQLGGGDTVHPMVTRIDAALSEPDPVHQAGDGLWWFWDETWANAHGPYTTEKLARGALHRYCDQFSPNVKTAPEPVGFHMTADKTTFTKADVEAITALAVAAALEHATSPPTSPERRTGHSRLTAENLQERIAGAQASPPDVQNVPDVWTLLEQARGALVTDGVWCRASHVALAPVIDAALTQRDRFVLVPKEPTNGMVDAAREAALHGAEVELSIFYLEVKAAIAAAPKPEGKP